ncbi:hypothetical protein [Aeromonas enteropelogenes]|uniref:Uncharacterized protein n=1 Tax=Aeromonas enteropelogenes TaxID=29489 RepID=A0ABU9J766_AEREN
MAKMTQLRWFNGTFGNFSISPTLITWLKAVPKGQEMKLDEPVEANIKVVGVSLITTALGANTTLSVKVGETIIIDAQNTTTAVKSYVPVDDLMTSEGQGISLLINGGAATGAVKLKLHYEMVGNL